MLSAVVGWFALKLLVASLKGRWSWLFGPYCIAVGVLTLVLKGCLKMLKSVPDPRIDRQKRHLLSDILAIAVLTYVSGGDGFRDMERYGVENRLHWVLDVVFLEDQCRARTGHAPENCSTLRKIALMLLRRNAIGGMGVGPMRKECAWDFDSARKVFLGGEREEVAA